MRMVNFAKRNFKELVRDPISLIFEIALPIFLLFIFQQFNIPGENYRLNHFTPGTIVFGFSFISLFTGVLVSKDRSSSLLIRLGVSPMKPFDYVAGYLLSILPIVLIQNVLFFITAILLGLKFSVYILLTIMVSLVVSTFFTLFGILVGTLVSEKASGGVGSIIVQLVCFTSGMYFPKEQVGKVFKVICEILPFEGILNIVKATLNNDISMVSIWNILSFFIYTSILFLITMLVFKKNMVSDNK